MSPRPAPLWRSPSRLVDLDATWQGRLDALLVSPRRLPPPLFPLLTLLTLLLAIAFLSHRPLHRDTPFSLVHRMSFSAPAAPSPPDPTLPFPPLALQSHPVPPSSPMRLRYRLLAALYLRPFARRRPLPRAAYLAPFQHQPAVCEGCVLVQVRRGVVYLHDPRAVRALMPAFRALRLREALRWLVSAVARGLVRDTELVLSTTDGVPTTARNHSFRMPPPQFPVPIFSVVRCNVSDNIPFPMVMADVMRRGLPPAYVNHTTGLLRHWDHAMRNVSNVDGAELPWSAKISKAVFRGTIRVSSLLRNTHLSDALCDTSGRTGLWHVARKHVDALQQFDLLQGQRRRIWPLPPSWFAPTTEPVLDVKVSGTCGSRIYVTDGMSMEKQNNYKYVIHAEGNSFWADRLLVQLFGSSAIIKQSTPCGMFFEPLLRPYQHYIPVDFSFQRLVRQTMWARANDNKVREIVQNARNFASEYLSTAGVQTYVDELLVQYTALLGDRDIKIESGAMQLYP